MLTLWGGGLLVRWWSWQDQNKHFLNDFKEILYRGMYFSFKSTMKSYNFHWQFAIFIFISKTLIRLISSKNISLIGTHLTSFLIWKRFVANILFPLVFLSLVQLQLFSSNLQSSDHILYNQNLSQIFYFHCMFLSIHITSPVTWS